MKHYLLDTNALSEASKPQPNAGFMSWFSLVDEQVLFTSCLALGEIQKGITLVGNSAKRSQLEKWLAKLTEDFEDRIIGVDGQGAMLWGTLVAKAQKKGKSAPAIDALIAAQCIQYKLVLVTRNVKDFEQFAGLDVLCPWSDER